MSNRPNNVERIGPPTLPPPEVVSKSAEAIARELRNFNQAARRVVLVTALAMLGLTMGELQRGRDE